MLMKRTIIACLLCLLCGSMAQAQKIRIKTGIEVLKEQNFKCLEGKRVGLITNPTGVDNKLKSTIDILHEAPNVNLVALYGPEHGVRGDVHAGDHVTDIKDPSTGLPVYSLYGKTRKATPEMLKDIDVLVYDIQDIGCRSFTYISTMGLAMEAAAENGKEFIVLDRPNPVGGLKIEGNLTEDDCISFVSQFKIPYLYGLTCGELALLLREDAERRKAMQTAGCKNERLEAQNGLHTDRLAMGSFIPAHPTSTFRIFLSCQRNFRRVRLHVYRSRLYDSVPDVCRYMGRSGETCQKPEQPGRTGCYLPAYVSETVLLRRQRRTVARCAGAHYGLWQSSTQ